MAEQLLLFEFGHCVKFDSADTGSKSLRYFRSEPDGLFGQD